MYQQIYTFYRAQSKINFANNTCYYISFIYQYQTKFILLHSYIIHRLIKLLDKKQPKVSTVNVSSKEIFSFMSRKLCIRPHHIIYRHRILIYINVHLDNVISFQKTDAENALRVGFMVSFHRGRKSTSSASSAKMENDKRTSMITLLNR